MKIHNKMNISRKFKMKNKFGTEGVAAVVDYDFPFSFGALLII
jgi:hypothetical protein